MNSNLQMFSLQNVKIVSFIFHIIASQNLRYGESFFFSIELHYMKKSNAL